jgi:hypothetical protein
MVMSPRLPLWALKYVEPTPLRHALARYRGVWILRKLKAQADSKYNPDTAFRLRCIFFHIPKTAGLAVCDGLFGDRAAGHMDVETAKVVFGEWRFRSFFKFCFVRNPWDRLVSAFHYLRHGHPDSPIANVVKASLSFTDFVNGALSSPIVQGELHIRPQHLFVVDKRGRLQMDYVGRFERLQRHFDVVAQRLGVTGRLARQNQSLHADYRDYYDDQTRRIVGEFYRRDIDLFGYRFDGFQE